MLKASVQFQKSTKLASGSSSSRRKSKLLWSPPRLCSSPKLFQLSFDVTRLLLAFYWRGQFALGRQCAKMCQFQKSSHALSPAVIDICCVLDPLLQFEFILASRPELHLLTVANAINSSKHVLNLLHLIYLISSRVIFICRNQRTPLLCHFASVRHLAGEMLERASFNEDYIKSHQTLLSDHPSYPRVQWGGTLLEPTLEQTQHTNAFIV